MYNLCASFHRTKLRTTFLTSNTYIILIDILLLNCEFQPCVIWFLTMGWFRHIVIVFVCLFSPPQRWSRVAKTCRWLLHIKGTFLNPRAFDGPFNKFYAYIICFALFIFFLFAVWCLRVLVRMWTNTVCWLNVCT